MPPSPCVSVFLWPVVSALTSRWRRAGATPCCPLSPRNQGRMGSPASCPPPPPTALPRPWLNTARTLPAGYLLPYIYRYINIYFSMSNSLIDQFMRTLSQCVVITAEGILSSLIESNGPSHVHRYVPRSLHWEPECCGCWHRLCGGCVFVGGAWDPHQSPRPAAVRPHLWYRGQPGRPAEVLGNTQERGTWDWLLVRIKVMY